MSCGIAWAAVGSLLFRSTAQRGAWVRLGKSVAARERISTLAFIVGSSPSEPRRLLVLGGCGDAHFRLAMIDESDAAIVVAPPDAKLLERTRELALSMSLYRLLRFSAR